MAWEKDINKQFSSDRARTIGLATLDNTTGYEASAPHYQFYELEAAEVIDIILDEEHPAYGSVSDIGKAQIRMLESGRDISIELLPWAAPLDSNVKSFPLKREIVIVASYVDPIPAAAGPVDFNIKYYYTQRLNIWGSVNINVLPFVSEPSTLLPSSEENKKNYDQTTTGNPNVSETDEIKFGQTFVPNSIIKGLKPYEGDIIYEGRFGNTIRFGSTTEEVEGQGWPAGPKVGSPILIIRNGQPDEITDEEYSLISEDINTDASSIWMTSDQYVPIQLANVDVSSHEGEFPDELSGKQVVITSDRLIFNSREAEFLGFAKKAIGFSTEGRFAVDANVKTVINSPEILLGLDASEPLVLGNELRDWLGSMLDMIKSLSNAIAQLTVGTPSGPSTPPINAATFTNISITDVSNLKGKLEKILSKQNKTL